MNANRSTPRSRRRAVPALLVLVVLAGCATFNPPRLPLPIKAPAVLPAGAQPYTGPTTPPPPETCNPTASLRPSGPPPAPGSAAARAVLPAAFARGYLRVGVDQNTLNWAYRDPTTNQLAGFDVDMLRQVAVALFGPADPADPDQHIHFVVVKNEDRSRAVAQGQVDIVAQTMTITCKRENDPPNAVDFSSVYYDAKQLLLVPNGSSIKGPDDLGGKRVCASAGSTSIQRVASLPVHPAVKAWQVTNQTDCLVMLQQHQVDAISTDDTILNGLAAQDPGVKVLTSPSLGPEPYGMAIATSNPGFTRFVNAVLEQERQDGTWARLYQTWLCPNGANTCTAPAPPAATYKD